MAIICLVITPDLSLIIPLCNEEGNINKLYEEITLALKRLYPYEVIFVDDGSTDSSWKILKKIATKNKNVKIVKLLTNYGQSNAIAAGIASSKGRIIVTMDGDLQYNPRDIPSMINKIKQGYHVVCGLRKRNNSDSFISKTAPSILANLLVRKVAGVKLKDSTGGMRAFSKKVVDIIPFYGEMHRYLPVLASWKGFKVTEIPVTIRKRNWGKTKYNYKRILRGLLDLFTIKFFMEYSTRPIYIFGSIGITSFTVGIIINLYFAYGKIFSGRHLYNDLASIILGVVLILMGIMFLGFGFIADMISYDAISSQKRETYIIEEVIS